MKYKFIFKQTMRQVGVIVFIACIAGFGIDYIRTDGIVMTENESQKEQSASETTENSLEVSLQEAKRLCIENKAVFLDARSPRQYEAGHIQDAKNLPIDQFDDHFDWLVSEVPEDTTIITYCDGKACSLGEELALMLKELGYKDVRVLVNGWSLWVENKYPTDKKEGVSKS